MKRRRRLRYKFTVGKVDANIFKVMRFSLLCDFYLVSLFFVAL